MNTEPTNAERRAWAFAALAEHKKAKHEGGEPGRDDDVTDLITDLFHYYAGVDIDGLIETCRRQYEREIKEETP